MVVGGILTISYLCASARNESLGNLPGIGTGRLSGVVSDTESGGVPRPCKESPPGGDHASGWKWTLPSDRCVSLR